MLEAGRDRLDEIMTAYAATLDAEATLEYEDTFTRAARKRYPRFAAEL